MPKKIKTDTDLQESENDKKHLAPEKARLDVPDVGDIPGQENIKIPRMKEYQDITASSADEEGDELFQDDLFDEESGDIDDEK
jgi:hypothetical protein